jgi:hypothetical protein
MSPRAAAFAVLRIVSLVIAVAILMLLGSRPVSDAPAPTAGKAAAKAAPAGDVRRSG